MAAQIFEVVGRDAQAAKDSSFGASWVIVNAASEAEALALLESQLPSTAYGLVVRKYGVKEIGLGTWQGSAEYGTREGGSTQALQQAREPGKSSTGDKPGMSSSPGDDAVFDFDTGSATQKITQSLETVQVYRRNDEPAAPPDFKGAIGVNGQQVEGCDVEVPSPTFSIRRRFVGSFVTLQWVVSSVNRYAMHTNAGVWKTFNPREVRFDGATGSQKGTGDPEITFKFSYRPTVVQTIGDIGPVTKRGWDYLWIRYEEKADSGWLKVPRFVYVERVYPTLNFATLDL